MSEPYPEAATEYNGDVECVYDECTHTADYRVEFSRNTAYVHVLMCDKCSQQNKIWVRENELLDNEFAEPPS